MLYFFLLVGMENSLAVLTVHKFYMKAI